jgi:[acyl-carrier-protein] S-malonyltransferase
MQHGSAAILCPGQGAQAVGMGRAWCDSSAAARAVFEEAERILGDSLGEPLRRLCFDGPVDRLNRTDICQPAIYTCSVASWSGLLERAEVRVGAAAGLSLGEYTALHLAGVFDFATGLRLVALRGALMQLAAETTRGGMLALIGADEAQARSICLQAAGPAAGEVLVCANFNAPGQIVLSGHEAACRRAADAAVAAGLRVAPLGVAGAFHSPLMQSAADRMAEALAATPLLPPQVPVWSNVTARPHDLARPELLRDRLVQQVVSPVRWAECCEDLIRSGPMELHELAPGSVLKGLMRRIDRTAKVESHDEP